jgi:hypothetical protein
LIHVAIAMALLCAITALLGYAFVVQDWPVLFLFAGALGAGVYVRSWWTPAVVYASVVLATVLIEVGVFVVMGATWWEQQNAEHWQGSDPALLKLSGQLIEIVVLGIIFVIPAVISVAIWKVIQRYRTQ